MALSAHTENLLAAWARSQRLASWLAHRAIIARRNGEKSSAEELELRAGQWAKRALGFKHELEAEL